MAGDPADHSTRAAYEAGRPRPRTVEDVLPSGYRFEAIPDGISVRTRGRGRADLYVNHETSKVPFPYNTANPTAANGENDFDNAQVSKLILNRHSAVC